MSRIFVLTTLLSVCALSFSALVGNNRYGAQHGGNSLGYQGPNRYPAGPHAHRAAPVQHQSYGAPRGPTYGSHQSAPAHLRGPAHLSAPRAPGHLSAPAHPRAPSHLSAPAHPRAPGHVSGPAPYAGPQHLPSPSLSHYSAPAHFAGPVQYGNSASYGAPSHHGPSPGHYSAPKRSVYQQPPHGQPQTYSQSHNTAESSSRTHGREMKYTINDPKNKGTTHVTETHVVSNRQMHGAEAEAAMKKLMGSMGPSSDGGFQDLIKGMGLNFY